MQSQLEHIYSLYNVHCDSCGTQYHTDNEGNNYSIPSSCANCGSNAISVRADQPLVDAIVAEKMAERGY